MLSSLQNIADHNQKTRESHLETLAKPCRFCNKRLAKYVCPRCGQGYCGVECYRSQPHEQCSEGFYREQVSNEVGAMKATEEEKKKMREVLEKHGYHAPEDGGPLEFTWNTETVISGRYDKGDDEEVNGDEEDENEDADDEDEEEDEETLRRRKDLEIRMAGLNIEEADFEEIWERLDSREREEFVRLAQELENEEKSTLIKD